MAADVKSKIQDLLEEIRHPLEEYTPVPFWFFNDEPEEGKIRGQMGDYAQKGVNGFVLHPRIGLPETLPYLSDEYFKWVRFIVSEAEKLRMKVVLYDEGMYPSGSAHGMVAAKNPAFASRGLMLRKAGAASALAEEGHADWEVRSDSDKKNGEQIIYRFSDGRELVYGFTGGTIRGIHYGEDDGEAAAPKSADILNPEAVECFIELTHERYYRELKEYFGSTVIGFFTDEPCALGRNAGGFREWTPKMAQEIIEEGGKLEELEGLFSGEENRTTAVYRRLVKKHLREVFYARLSRWCEVHGIALMGHPAESDDVEEELYFHVPGQDLIMRRVSPETGGITERDSVQAKLTADIARLLGRRRNMNECFGVCSRPFVSGGKSRIVPWYFTGRDMIWYLNWLAFRGVNLFVPHAFYYSLAGKRKEERPPDVGPGNIWWKHYKKISDYIKRLSFLMTDSDDYAKVVVLCDNNRVPCQEVAELYERQIPFRYLPVMLLETYAAKPANACRIVLNLLGEEWDAVLERYGMQTVHSVREMTEKRLAFPVIETKEPCPALRAVRLSKNGTDMYLLSNEGAETIRTEFVIPDCAGLLEINLWDGTSVYREVAARQPCFLELAPCRMLLLLPCSGAEAPEAERKAEEALREGRWGKSLAIGSAISGERWLGDWTEKFSLIAQKENRAEYALSYDTDKPDEGGCFTVMGEELAECCCNGEFVGFSLYGPHSFSLKGHLKKGKNEICLAFTGNAANLYDDAGIPFGIGADGDRGNCQRVYSA